MEIKLTKKIKEIIKGYVECMYFRIKFGNYPRKLFQVVSDMKSENITKEYNSIEDIIFKLNGVEVAKMERQYSTKKVCLTYKELKPKLIFFS